jgi:hypothetical protein
MLSKIIQTIAALITIYLGWIFVEQNYINNKLELNVMRSEKVYHNNNDDFFLTKFIIKNHSDNIINNEQFHIPYNTKDLISFYLIKHYTNKNLLFTYNQNKLNFEILKLKKNDKIEIMIISKSVIDIYSLRINEKDFLNKNILNTEVQIVTNNYTSYYLIGALLICAIFLYILSLKLKFKNENVSWIEKYMKQKDKTQKTEDNLEECIKMHNEVEKDRDKIKEEYIDLLKMKVKEK